MKYELDQIIHYMRDNRPHSAPVLARSVVESLHPDWNSTNEQKQLFTPFGTDSTLYATCHGIVNESEAYASRSDMFAAFDDPTP